MDKYFLIFDNTQEFYGKVCKAYLCQRCTKDRSSCWSMIELEQSYWELLIDMRIGFVV